MPNCKNLAAPSYPQFRNKVAYQEGKLPAQVMMADVTPFQPLTITDLERTQFWTMPDAEDVLQKCR